MRSYQSIEVGVCRSVLNDNTVSITKSGPQNDVVPRYVSCSSHALATDRIGVTFLCIREMDLDTRTPLAALITPRFSSTATVYVRTETISIRISYIPAHYRKKYRRIYVFLRLRPRLPWLKWHNMI